MLTFMSHSPVLLPPHTPGDPSWFHGHFRSGGPAPRSDGGASRPRGPGGRITVAPSIARQSPFPAPAAAIPRNRSAIPRETPNPSRQLHFRRRTAGNAG